MSEPRPEVRIVSGHLSDAEIAAVGVALAAMNAASRAEAAQRAPEDGAPAAAWADAGLRLGRPSGAAPGPGTWSFSHR